MPGSTLPNMLITLPSLGGDSGQWDDLLNAALSTIDEHDHTSDKGVRITPAAMNINADLSFGGNAATALGKVAFSAVTALAAGSKTLFVSSADNELYWRTNGGTNVKLTSGTSINTTLVGGIVGDYSSVGAEVAYDDATDSYTFKQQGSKPWARVRSGEVRIYETGTTESVYVGFAAPAALGASYTITLPTAVPGLGTFLQMSSSGVISASNTVGGTVTAADFFHTSPIELQFPASAWDDAGTHTRNAGGTSGAHNRWSCAASSNRIWVPIQLPTGATITEWSIFVDKDTNAAATIRGRLYKTNVTDGTESALAVGDDNDSDAPGFVVLNESGLSIQTDEEHMYYLVFTPSGSVTPAADTLYGGSLRYSRS